LAITIGVVIFHPVKNRLKPFVIGITGASGSGKTSLLLALRKQFSEEEICIISQDEYYVPRENQIIDDRGIKNFDLPASIDQVSFYRDVSEIISGKTVERTKYTYNNPPGQVNVKYLPAPILIVEGLFVFFRQEVESLIDLKVYMHAKDNLNIIRRIKRDQSERNYTVETVLYRYERHVLPAFEDHILPFRERADIVINNNDDFEKGLRVLSGFIRNFLNATHL